MPADPVKSELMRGHSESFVGQLDRLDFSLILEHDVIDPIAYFTNKVLMLLHQRIEMLRSAAHQDLQLLIGNQLLQVPVNCAKADAR
jgi:hypothetical protein